MATYTDGIGFNLNNAGFPAHTAPRTHMLEVTMDFAAITAARLAAGATALASADILNALRIPAMTLVQSVGLEVLTAGTAGLTLDVGDGTAADGFHDGRDGAAAGSFVNTLVLSADATPVVVGYTNGKYYSAADTIDLVLVGQVPGALKVRLWALVVDCQGVARA